MNATNIPRISTHSGVLFKHEWHFNRLKAMMFLMCSLVSILSCRCHAVSGKSRLAVSRRLSRDDFPTVFLPGLLSVMVALSSCDAIEFVSPDSSFSFQYPDEFQVSEKILGLTVKTHDYEVLLKSQKTRGFTAGLTVDAVKIDDIRKFSSPEALGKRVIDVEIKKGNEDLL